MPHVTNEDRAMWAAEAVRNFQHEIGPSDCFETAMGDLFTNMLHLAASMGIEDIDAYVAGRVALYREEAADPFENGTETL